MKCEKCGVGGLIWSNPLKEMPKEVICDKCKAAMSDIKRYDLGARSMLWENPENGAYVSYADHLAAIEALKGKLEEGDVTVEGDTKKEGAKLYAFIGGRWVDTTPRNDHEKRIDALEKWTLEQMGLYVDPDGDKKGFWIFDKRFSVMLDGWNEKNLRRIEGLEKALNEHMVKEPEKAEVGVVATADIPLENFKRKFLPDGFQSSDYNFAFDASASPTGIPFEVALAYAKTGRNVTRAAWGDTKILRVEGHPLGSLMIEDVMANDWMVIPETAA
jgi:hypothetical protein